MLIQTKNHGNVESTVYDTFEMYGIKWCVVNAFTNGLLWGDYYNVVEHDTGVKGGETWGNPETAKESTILKLEELGEKRVVDAYNKAVEMYGVINTAYEQEQNK